MGSRIGLTGLIQGLTTAQVDVVAIGPAAARTYTGREGIATVTSELAPGTARTRAFAAVVIPGGYAPDRIRMRHGMLDLVREAVAAGYPVAAIGHGAQVLISAAVIRGRTVTAGRRLRWMSRTLAGSTSTSPLSRTVD